MDTRSFSDPLEMRWKMLKGIVPAFVHRTFIALFFLFFFLACSSRFNEDLTKTRTMLLSFVRNYPAIKMAKRRARAKQKGEKGEKSMLEDKPLS